MPFPVCCLGVAAAGLATRAFWASTCARGLNSSSELFSCVLGGVLTNDPPGERGGLACGLSTFGNGADASLVDAEGD